MKRNLKLYDRALRWILSVGLLTWAIAGGPWWSFVGIYFLVTGSFGFCPAYFLLKINRNS